MEKKNYLILDDEFIQYCNLNNIEDIEMKAKEVFDKGFTLLKYGSNPIVKNETFKKVSVKKDFQVKINKDTLYDD